MLFFKFLRGSQGVGDKVDFLENDKAPILMGVQGESDKALVLIGVGSDRLGLNLMDHDGGVLTGGLSKEHVDQFMEQLAACCGSKKKKKRVNGNGLLMIQLHYVWFVVME